MHRVSAEPAVLQVGAIYFQDKGNNKADFYFGNSLGQRHDIVTDEIINSLIVDQITTLERSKVVADIEERDTMQATEGDRALVLDATADPTVEGTGGKTAANYVYTGTDWKKTFEEGEIDVDFSQLTVNWSQLVGAPTSTPAQIDAAVGNAHTHANKAVIDGFTEDVDGNINYKGAKVSADLAWASEEY